MEQKKLREFVELFVEDGKWVHPYHSGLFPAEVQGREEIYQGLHSAAGNFDEIHFPIEEILPFKDPNKVAVKFSGKLYLKGGKGTYENSYLAIFTFDVHGKIVEWVEYYNPVIAAKAFGLMDKLQ
jgi:ketosteroid isomerase-like protein